MEHHRLGPVALLISNVGLLFSTFILRNVTIDALGSIIVLLFANVVATFPLIKEKLYGLAKQEPSLRDDRLGVGVALTGWALSYASIYLIMLEYKTYISIPHLVLSESLAPFLALPFSSRARFEFVWPIDLIKVLLCVMLLLSLAQLEWSSGIVGFEGHWYLFVPMTILFVIAQASARYISYRRPAGWAPMRMSALAVFPLAGFIGMRYGLGELNVTIEMLVAGIVIGAVFIPLIRGTFIYGLANSPGTTAALLLSTTVPMSLIADMLESGHMRIASAVLSVLYTLLVGVLSYIRYKRLVFYNRVIS